MSGLAGTKRKDRETLRDYCDGLGKKLDDNCIRSAKKSGDKEIRKVATRAMSIKNLNKDS